MGRGVGVRVRVGAGVWGKEGGEGHEMRVHERQR